MQVERLADGLWRWTTAPAPGTDEPLDRLDVGSVYLETSEAVILFDPAVPPDGTAEAARFWRALDADVARRGMPVVVLLTRPRHARATAAVLDRYAAVGAEAWTVVGRADALPAFAIRRFDPAERLPGGVVAHEVPFAGGEAAYELPGRSALVVGDAAVGRGAGELRVAAHGVDGDELRTVLERLARRGPERVLPAHGGAVLRDGAGALRRASAQGTG